MESFQAGCDDYIDRHLSPGVIANHIKNIIISKLEGFQPTQMLGQADTSLSGNLTHHDLTGVMQMLGQARQTGALTINAGETDAVLFTTVEKSPTRNAGRFLGMSRDSHLEELRKVRGWRLQIYLRRGFGATHGAAFGNRPDAGCHARI